METKQCYVDEQSDCEDDKCVSRMSYSPTQKKDIHLVIVNNNSNNKTTTTTTTTTTHAVDQLDDGEEDDDVGHSTPPDDLSSPPTDGKRQKKTPKPRLPWTAVEDRRLFEVVSRLGPRQWGKIAQALPNRTAKQCRERWHNHVDPDVKKGDWSANEDEVIQRMVEQHGFKWANIARTLGQRTDNMVKNRYFGLLQRKLAANKSQKKNSLIQTPPQTEEPQPSQQLQHTLQQQAPPPAARAPPQQKAAAKQPTPTPTPTQQQPQPPPPSPLSTASHATVSTTTTANNTMTTTPTSSHKHTFHDLQQLSINEASPPCTSESTDAPRPPSPVIAAPCKRSRILLPSRKKSAKAAPAPPMSPPQGPTQTPAAATSSTTPPAPPATTTKWRGFSLPNLTSAFAMDSVPLPSAWEIYVSDCSRNDNAFTLTPSFHPTP